MDEKKKKKKFTPRNVHRIECWPVSILLQNFAQHFCSYFFPILGRLSLVGLDKKYPDFTIFFLSAFHPNTLFIHLLSTFLFFIFYSHYFHSNQSMPYKVSGARPLWASTWLHPKTGLMSKFGPGLSRCRWPTLFNLSYNLCLFFPSCK